jgi:subtilisin-like proprotein convertase family protein
MSLPIRRRVARRFAALTFAVALATPGLARAASEDSAAADLAQLSEHARQQIAAIQADKAARTPAQRKISSSLLYMGSAKRGLFTASAGLRSLTSASIGSAKPDLRVTVDISATNTKAVAVAIEAAGGKVLYGHARGALIRAQLPYRSLETLAARADVRSIRPAMQAATSREATAARVRDAVASLADGGSVTSEGVAAHRVLDARHFYGLTGAGVKIGVLSDSDDSKEASIASGDLPEDTVTLPGQDGRPGSGEGTAMMEIVHDVAPGAQIYFATAFTSPESFADNIRALRAAGCDIIVDDVIYYFESPFQDDIVAKAVEDVIADGAFYFSSAGNSGGLNNGTAGVWEGDFKKAKGTIPVLDGQGDIHDFGAGVVSNRVELESGPLYLHWSDPGSLGNEQSGNDYDLYVLDPTLSSVAVAATDVQDGDDLPFEFLGFSIPADFRVVIVKFSGEDRALRVTLSRGELALSTSGAVYGHNSAPGAYAVAAVDAATAGGGAFTGGATNPVETFSSDGNRRVFYDSAGVAYKPGKATFKKGGAVSRAKPDIAAADGVATTLDPFSGLNPFFGTSAAAPHAAAIAGLLKAAKPGITAGQMRTALTKPALDIEAVGKDRDSGSGIVDAVGSLANIKAKAAPFLELGTVAATAVGGDGDDVIDPGDSATLLTELHNLGGAAPTNLAGVLSTTTAGVTILNPNSTWPAIAPGGSANNNTPFAFNLGPGLACGTAPDFDLTTTYSNGALSPQVFSFRVQTGEAGGPATDADYAGPVTPIPDDDPDGVAIPLTVAGAPGAISKLVFSIDGSACSTGIGSTTVGIDHTWVGDIVLTLTSPAGTSVTIVNQAGGGLNSGNNFCQTVLDDAAVNSIQAVTSAGAPYTGTFKPANPLSAFIGEDPNGVWTLTASDNAFLDTGSVRAFSLSVSGFVCD